MQEPDHTMQSVDFLPSEYRQRYARQRRQTWRTVALGAVGLAMLAAAFHQSQTRRRIEQELAITTPQYEKALATTKQLGEIQSELALARADAELFTWIGHPWPRSRIIAALLEPLPDEIGFTRLEIHRQSQPVKTRQDPLSFPGKTGADDPSALPPAARDLQQLRAKFDTAPTVVSVEGVAAESGVLHQYLSELNRQGLFLRAELESLETEQLSDGPVLRFHATLTVRPGYGVPGGPAEPPQPAAAATTARSENRGDQS